MEQLLSELEEAAWVLDLGAGAGSFPYHSTPARVLAVDLSFPAGAQPCHGRVVAGAEAIPLREGSVDVVVCNHTLEHFQGVERALQEIDRVLKRGGKLWAAVPDARFLDDRLYRWIFKGGGHVNQFSLPGFIQLLQSRTGLRARAYKKLYSGFVYLNAPDPIKAGHYPKRARLLHFIPPFLLRKLLRWWNYLLRVADRSLGTDWSVYGWALLFEASAKGPTTQKADLSRLQAQEGDVNVCFRCGTAHPLRALQGRLQRFLFWKLYRCRRCGEKNLFCQPLGGDEERDLEAAPLQAVAEEIFGKEDSRSVSQWVRFWKQSRERSAFMVETFRPLVLLDFQDKCILDIGCGTGAMGELISSECRVYVGGDLHQHVLRFARSGPNRHYVLCNGTELPFPEESFDYIFALDVLEHVVGGEREQIRFLRELNRVLRPLGMIFFSTPNRWYPYEGHTQLIGPQYLPPFLRDRYIRWRNPGFLKEHSSFSEITSLGPVTLRRCLRDSGLCFLHDLPCGMDRRDYLKVFPLRGTLAYLGLGWVPHAEFWGILVRRENRHKLRLKLRKYWYYEQNQPSPTGVREFGPRIDYEKGYYNHQLGPGWYWHERDQRGFRWLGRQATCFLQSNGEARYLHLRGFSPRENHLQVWVEGIRVGEHPIPPNHDFALRYLLPFSPHRGQDILEVKLCCRRTFRSENPADTRDLGVMLFSLGISDRLDSC